MGFGEVHEVFRDNGQQDLSDCVEQGDGVIGLWEGVIRFVGLAKDWGCQCFPCFRVVF